MFKLSIINVITFSFIIFQYQIKSLSSSSVGCLQDGISCISSTQCCNANCLNNICAPRPCRKINETCSEPRLPCCDGTECRETNNKCCVPINHQAQSYMECCTNSWNTNNVRTGGICCSGHGQSCTTEADCCTDNMDCMPHEVFGYICI